MITSLVFVVVVLVCWLVDFFQDKLSLWNSFHNITVNATTSPAKTIYFSLEKQIFSAVLLSSWVRERNGQVGPRQMPMVWQPRVLYKLSCLQQTIRDHIKNGPGPVDI